MLEWLTISLINNKSILFVQEEADVRLHVQEALSLMSVAYKDLEGPNTQIMEVLIMSNIEKVSTDFVWKQQ